MKKHLVFLTLTTLAFSPLMASSCGSCDKSAATVVVSAEEATFASKLSNHQFQAFSLMNPEQRQEVFIAEKEGMNPDEAVDLVLQKHHLTLVEGALVSNGS